MFASDLDPGFWILNPAVSPQFLEALEKNYDEQFAVVFEAIKQLIAPPKKQIGSVPKKAPLGSLLWNSVVLSPLTADM